MEDAENKRFSKMLRYFSKIIYIYICRNIWFCVFNFPVSNLLIHLGVAKLTQFRSTLARHLRLCGPKVLGRMVEALELQLGRRVFTTVPSCSSPWWMVGDYFGYFYTHCITRLGRPKNDLGWTCQFCAMNCVFFTCNYTCFGRYLMFSDVAFTCIYIFVHSTYHRWNLNSLMSGCNPTCWWFLTPGRKRDHQWFKLKYSNLSEMVYPFRPLIHHHFPYNIYI